MPSVSRRALTVLSEEARRRLSGFANGDGRSLLMALEFVAEQAVRSRTAPDGDDAVAKPRYSRKTLRS
jgi:replication-associated recombination protein RarA